MVFKKNKKLGHNKSPPEAPLASGALNCTPRNAGVLNPMKKYVSKGLWVSAILSPGSYRRRAGFTCVQGSKIFPPWETSLAPKHKCTDHSAYKNGFLWLVFINSFHQKPLPWDYVKTLWGKLDVNLLYFETITYAVVCIAWKHLY